MKQKGRKRVKSKSLRRKTILSLFCFMTIFFLMFLIGKNIVNIAKKYDEKKSLESDLSLLQETEVELKNEALMLQDPDYIARYAREKYFFSKNGEIILILPEN